MKPAYCNGNLYSRDMGGRYRDRREQVNLINNENAHWALDTNDEKRPHQDKDITKFQSIWIKIIFQKLLVIGKTIYFANEESEIRAALGFSWITES